MREFVNVIEQSSSKDLDSHLRHKDFSRWIGGVFGDYALANSVRDQEEDYVTAGRSEVVQNIAREIRSRYEFTQEQQP